MFALSSLHDFHNSFCVGEKSYADGNFKKAYKDNLSIQSKYD